MSEKPPVSQLAEETALKAVEYEFESHRGDHPIYGSMGWKVYGPYQSITDLRRRVVARRDFEQVTISYPRFMMECKLKRLLLPTEEVHHKNEIEFDDRLDNYEVINSTEHRQNHNTKFPERFVCPVCDTTFFLEGTRLSTYKSNKKRRPGMKGPYCSRSCSGKVNN